MTLKLNSKYLDSFINSDELAGIKPQVETAVELLHNKKGLGNDFLGFLLGFGRGFGRFGFGGCIFFFQSEILFRGE